MQTKAAVSALAATLVLAGPAGAATITSWNTENVEVGPVVPDGVGGTSVVYDRALPDAAATTNGRIYYEAPEANSPGLRVSDTDYATKGGANQFDGCILASSTADCDSPFQSGKRFKQQFTSPGAIDLVFDVETTDSESIFEVYHRAVNLTGRKLKSIQVSLGTGVGADFARSVAGDGLGFSPSVQLGPNNLPAFTQYPFGLFGSEDQPNPNPNFTLGGFFDPDARAGFDLTFSEDLLASDGYYGAYDDLFGNWLSREMVPLGLLWDYALGTADPLVMAWDNGSAWEVRRGIDTTLDGDASVISVNDVYALDQSQWMTFAYGDTAGVEAFLGGISLFDDPIEDLANLNLTYAIRLGSDFAGDRFTLRVEVAPVPLPAAGPMLFAAVAAGLALRRRRRG